MKRTIDLNPEYEHRLNEWAKALRTDSEEAALSILTQFVLRYFSPSGRDPEADLVVKLDDRLLFLEIKESLGIQIKSRPQMMGGDHCIRNTRIPIWLLVSYKRQGMSDQDLLANYPGLNADDLAAAWDFYAANAEAIDGQRKRNEGAA